MRILFNIKSPGKRSRIKYVLQSISNHPCAPEDLTLGININDANLQIQYGGEANESTNFYIPSQDKFFISDSIETAKWFANEYVFEKLRLFSVEKKRIIKGEFVKGNCFGFDLLECIFFHLSRYEEQFCEEEKKDEHGMMWEKYQILVREGIYKNPVVDHLVYAFFKAIGVQPKLLISQYSLTHDIDSLLKYKTIYRASRALIRCMLDHNIYKGFGIWWSSYFASIKDKANDPYNCFKDLIVDKSTIIFQEKTLYLMSGGKSKHDNFYKLSDPKISGLLKLAEERGYKIGLHSSYLSNENLKMFENEKSNLEKRLNSTVNVNRQHFLRFTFPTTANILDACGIEQDSTLGYQRLYGFRCGTGFPFHLYDFEKEKAFTFFEKPMILMDGAWLNESEEKLPAATEEWTKFCFQNRYHTHITFNFHNTIFDPLKRDSEGLMKWYKNTFIDGEYFPSEIKNLRS